MDVGEIIVWLVFLGAAVTFVGSGVGVVSLDNPFLAAIALIGNLASLAVFYLLLSAEFVAAAQVLVYAGAVMVMFLFVTAYLGGEQQPPWRGSGWQVLAAVTAGTAVLVEIFLAIGLKAGDRLSDEQSVRSSFGGPAQIGRVFLTDHLLAFEITSIVLLVAAVGGVVLGAHSRRDAAGA